MESQLSPKSQRLSPRRNSSYTLRTIDDERSGLLKGGDASPAPQYGAVPADEEVQRSAAENRRKLLIAGITMAIVFVVSTVALFVTLKLALPPLEEEDREYLRVPKSFEQLQQLNTLLKKYRSLYPFRVVLCFVITYLFLQAFSLPGSMYMSILAGAVWGPPRAIPLCCTCVASGATLCYFIGAAFGPAFLVLPSWKARLDVWTAKIRSERANLIPFLIVIRIAPFPPHWVVNVLCPHLGIGLVPFFISTWLGIMGVTVIHTTIGGGLDQMTSAADFHLISLQNFLGLSAIVVAVMIPVGIRWYYRGEIESVAAVEAQASVEAGEAQEPDLVKRPPGPLVFGAEDEDLFLDDAARLPGDWKGKGVDRDWLMDSDVDAYDDEPLPPPPSPPSGGGSYRDIKEPSRDNGDIKDLV